MPGLKGSMQLPFDWFDRLKAYDIMEVKEMAESFTSCTYEPNIFSSRSIPHVVKNLTIMVNVQHDAEICHFDIRYIQIQAHSCLGCAPVLLTHVQPRCVVRWAVLLLLKHTCFCMVQ